MSLASTLVLAHQSDWFSVTLVSLPMLGFVAILAVAKRRVDRDGPVAVGDDAIPHEPERRSGSWH